MSSKKGNIIELFADKAVLAVAGLIALIVLYIFVIRNPNSIEYAGKELSPTAIDNLVNQKAIQLQNQLRNEPNAGKQYKSKETEYLSMMQNSIKDVNTTISFPLPGYSTQSLGPTNRVYRVPQVGKIEEPSVAIVRMAAFVPTEELSPTLTYESAETKLEDIDLVTVESSIDSGKLYSQFRESFAGRNISQEWRKEQYAKPVFAKVQLQRRTQQPDGSWSDWADVPQTKVCHLKKNLELPKQATEFGMEMAIVQFSKSEFRDEVLQPRVYYNAIPSEPWISPPFYNERQKRIVKEQEDVRRQEIEAEKARKLQERANPSSLRQPTRQSTRPAVAPQGDMFPGGRDAGGRQDPRQQPTTTRRTIERPARTEKTVATQPQASTSEMEMYDAIRLRPDTNPADLEKLVFWAHDDTTKPGEKYQYRIRIGVFNPIAATNWFSEEQQNLRDQVVLWSDFTEATDMVEIPQTLHFFATDIREIEKGSSVDKTVEVTVARYMLGNWVIRKYSVKSGEEIGKAGEPADARLEQAGISSDTIDFSTGAVMVDARRVTEWIGTGSLRSREYNELLYSLDGKEIEKMPIKERFWPGDVSKVYKEISAALDAEPVMLLDWGQAAGGGGGTRTPQQQRMPMQEPVPGGGFDPFTPRMGP
ncbi:MAG: hypothetical protein WC496_08010 [Phycisphaerae bacterium]|jgi:hypothetical protein